MRGGVFLCVFPPVDSLLFRSLRSAAVRTALSVLTDSLEDPRDPRPEAGRGDEPAILRSEITFLSLAGTAEAF